MSKRGEGDFDSGYDKKICSLTSSGDQVDLKLIKQLVKDSRYVCRTCGRSAADSERLCSPETM
jgi:hypothetical protein